MSRFNFRTVMLAAMTAAVCVSLAHAGKETSMSFDKPSKAGTVHVKFWRNTGEYDKVDVPIGAYDPNKPGAWAQQKRDAIYDALVAKGYTAEKVGTDGIKLKDLADYTTKVYFRTGDTGEGLDEAMEEQTPSATIVFDNLNGPIFQPFDVSGQPAVFSAGIVTDAGVLSAQVSAVDLNFQTQGPIICQALFQRLAPRAPQYGAQINFAGDRLEIYFDPAFTVTQGGILFGTTSPTEGCMGGIEPVAQLPCVGDTNHDGHIDLVDLTMVLGTYGTILGDPNYNPDCDLNHDGQIDLIDVSVELSLYGATCP